MNVQSLRHKTGRLALATASTGFIVGLAFLNSGSAHAIGGLCNGRPASHTWLDASGQYGPALIDGTDHDDTIVGSDGDDTISGNGGDDVICGAAGDDSIAGGSGDDAVRGDTGDDSLDGGS
ncbi:MAG: Peptidase serralysin terminal, partial [Actinomycetota bacterium]|nr:Peptidase serralysin terminal [Actinomycetota bacterium]